MNIKDIRCSSDVLLTISVFDTCLQQPPSLVAAANSEEQDTVTLPSSSPDEPNTTEWAVFQTSRPQFIPAKVTKMNRRMLCITLFIAVLPCMAKANEELISPYDMTVSDVDKSSSPASPASPAYCGLDELKLSLAQLIQEEQESRGLFGEMVKALNQLVQENKEAASVQVEVLKVLRAMNDRGEPEINHLQSMARLQSLLVENHQALLLQTSRIATMMQDQLKKQSQ
ncbi:hypothetical protein F2P79_022020 [Pimephales promelas]|nr:hypothetical protein F2P79_022020 [Pimephales promelas]